MSGQRKTENTTPYIDRGEPLPASYAENRIVAMVRDPEMLFTYWDIETEVRVASNPIMLRICCITEESHHDIDVDPQANNMYLTVTPNRAYQVQLFERCPAAEGGSSGELRLLATTNEITTPVRWAGESGTTAPEEVRQALRYPLTRGVASRRVVPILSAEALAAKSDQFVPPSPAPAPASGDVSGPYYSGGAFS